MKGSELVERWGPGSGWGVGTAPWIRLAKGPRQLPQTIQLPLMSRGRRNKNNLPESSATPPLPAPLTSRLYFSCSSSTVATKAVRLPSSGAAQVPCLAHSCSQNPGLGPIRLGHRQFWAGVGGPAAWWAACAPQNWGQPPVLYSGHRPWMVKEELREGRLGPGEDSNLGLSPNETDKVGACTSRKQRQIPGGGVAVLIRTEAGGVRPDQEEEVKPWAGQGLPRRAREEAEGAHKQCQHHPSVET